MLSYWEQKHFTSYDHIIIGAGIVGLSTAACILEKKPKAKLLVLERGLFPAGASTKNAGFACFGEISELVSDIKQMGESKTATLVEARWLGLRKLRKRIGDKNLNFQSYGGFEAFQEHQIHYIDHKDEINKLLKPVFRKDVFSHADSEIKRFEFNTNVVKKLIKNNFGGQLDSGLMMKQLLRYVQEKGALVLTGANVTSIDVEHMQVVVEPTILNTELRFKGNNIAVCTNGFANNILPSLHIEPARGQVLITKPLKNLSFQGTLQFNEGYYYLRNIDNRLLFGGGRNLDFSRANTYTFGPNEKILEYLEATLRELFLKSNDFDIDSTWSGIMGFSDTKEPLIETHFSNVHIGVALGGMGVALGSNVAEKLALRML